MSRKQRSKPSQYSHGQAKAKQLFKAKVPPSAKVGGSGMKSALQNATIKKKNEGAAGNGMANIIKALAYSSRNTTNKGTTGVPSATIANGAAASKMPNECTVGKEKNKKIAGKELSITTTVAVKKEETGSPSKSVISAMNAASKKHENTTVKAKIDSKESETCIIHTTGVAKKRKNSPANSAHGRKANEGQPNGVKSESAQPTKKRRTSDFDSESNSEAESYIDKFFGDVSDDAADAVTTEDSEDDYDSGDSEEDYEDYDGEALPFDDLVQYYGQRRDVKEKQKLKTQAGKKSPTASKKAPVSKASAAGWIEEDNDRGLQYETECDGDEHVATARKKDASTKVNKKSEPEVHVVAKKSPTQRLGVKVSPAGAMEKFTRDSFEEDSLWELEEKDSEESTYDEDSLGEEESTDDEDSLGEEETTDDEEYFYDDHRVVSDPDDSEGSWTSDDSEDSGLNYMRQPFDSDSYDEDYEPSDPDFKEDEVQYIPRGMAHIYDIDDDSIPYDEDGPRIVELPVDYGYIESMRVTTDGSSHSEAASDTSIPSLVPIYNASGEFVDSPEKLSKQPAPTAQTTTQPTSGGKDSSKPAVATQEAMETDPSETVAQLEAKRDSAASETIPGDPATGDDDVMEEEEEGEVEAAGESVDSSFYRFYDSIDSRMALCVLKQNIYFYGHMSVQALSGSVEIQGYRLEPGETKKVYAARGYDTINLIPLPSTEPLDRASLKNALSKVKLHFVDADLGELVETFDPKESVLVLLDTELPGTGHVPLISSHLEECSLFPSINTLHGKGAPFRRTEKLLEVEFFTRAQVAERPIPVFQKDPAWDEVRLDPSSRLMVVGGKGAGKSTLCQYLANKFIRPCGRILLLDLDIGQPLVHLPETISATVLQEPILGVGYFADIQPLRCQLFGSLNVVSSPLMYIQNVSALVEQCEADETLKDVPWIVNTMGYVSGFGEELLVAITRLVQPTDLIQLTIPRCVRGAQNYEHQQTDGHANGYKFNILKDQLSPQQLQRQLAYRFYPLDVRFEARGLPLHPPKRRTLAIMAKLVKILANANCELFTDVKPVSAPFDELQILITRDDYTPSKDMMQNVLNAMMVYLCELQDNGLYNCLGLGIVRAVDENNNVHLLHYLPADQLARAKVLALCNTSLPSRIYLRLSAQMDGTIPYLQNVG